MIETLVAALAKAQANMTNAALNKVNPHFRSRYAGLAAIRDAAVPALAGQGVALVQVIETREGGAVVVTKLLKGEEQICSECPVIVGETHSPQQFGSALTYARRYSMAALVGISAEEDDDANAAEASATARKAASPPPRRPAPPSAPAAPAIPVPMTEAKEADWPAFAAALKAKIAKAADVSAVNALVKAHNKAISTLKASAPDLCKELEDFTRRRRSVLAQAPLEARDAPPPVNTAAAE